MHSLVFHTKTTAYEIEAVVSQRVGKKALDILAGVLPPTIAYRIEKALPDLLYRSLMPRLTHTLTRSVTHALVPVLAESITHTDRQDYFCYACYYHHKYCNLCHYSATSAYYNSYYATYYSDYYSDCKFIKFTDRRCLWGSVTPSLRYAGAPQAPSPLLRIYRIYSFTPFSLSLSLSLSHTHTHTFPRRLRKLLCA